MTTLELILITFAITLIVNKSQVMASKREFVKQFYEASLLNGPPPFLHTFWYKMWTCAMCFGFWVSLILSYMYREGWEGVISTTLIVFGMNWLLHCIENYFFQHGYHTEMLINKELTEKKK
jgi:hypothetical protein